MYSKNSGTISNQMTQKQLCRFIRPSAVRSCDLLPGDIMETAAIFIGW